MSSQKTDREPLTQTEKIISERVYKYFNLFPILREMFLVGEQTLEKKISVLREWCSLCDRLRQNIMSEVLWRPIYYRNYKQEIQSRVWMDSTTKNGSTYINNI